MTDNVQISAIMSAGMKLLRENLYEDMSLDELMHSATAYMKEHPELIPKNAKII